jgi:hypothetical protein
VSNRIKDPSAIEARLLELAHTTDVTITAAALAYYAPCSIDDATAVLDALAARDRVSMDIEDDGTVVYRLLGRQKIAARPLPAPAVAPRALIPVVREHREASPTLAALLTLFVPGAGHLYAGRFVAAVLWFLVVGAGYALILPGLILHLFSMVSAASAAHQLNVGRRFELASAY